jgi:pectin methylesterase-like acyl-CoA thioesterase
MTGGKLMKNTLKILVVSAIFGAILTGCGTSAEGNNDAANAAAPATSMEKKSMGKADDATVSNYFFSIIPKSSPNWETILFVFR